jgi:hypothetical protein
MAVKRRRPESGTAHLRANRRLRAPEARPEGRSIGAPVVKTGRVSKRWSGFSLNSEVKKMPNTNYDTSTEYELLVKSIYEAILNQGNAENFEVKHNQKLVGKSGVAHQIDVLWRFRQTGITFQKTI